MAVPAISLTVQLPAPEALTATQLLDVLEYAMHSSQAEWLFFRELRVGTGREERRFAADGRIRVEFSPHTGMKRICYEVKIARSDFLSELKRPLKRRIGMRYSNEFYFVTPPGLVDVREIPSCGLIEAGLRDGGRVEAADGPACRIFSLRSGDSRVLHDHRSGPMARYARSHMAARRGDVAASAAGTS